MKRTIGVYHPAQQPLRYESEVTTARELQQELIAKGFELNGYYLVEARTHTPLIPDEDQLLPMNFIFKGQITNDLTISITPAAPIKGADCYSDRVSKVKKLKALFVNSGNLKTFQEIAGNYTYLNNNGLDVVIANLENALPRPVRAEADAARATFDSLDYMQLREEVKKLKTKVSADIFNSATNGNYTHLNRAGLVKACEILAAHARPVATSTPVSKMSDEEINKTALNLVELAHEITKLAKKRGFTARELKDALNYWNPKGEVNPNDGDPRYANDPSNTPCPHCGCDSCTCDDEEEDEDCELY
jgi:hypothetical protein